MRILKYLFLLVVLTLVSLTVYIATLENKYHVSRSIVVNQPQELVFDYVHDLNNWAEILPSRIFDTTTVSFVRDKMGTTTQMDWISSNVKKSVQNLKSFKTDSLQQRIVLQQEDLAGFSWHFGTKNKNPKKTEIKVEIEGQVSFQDKIEFFLKGGAQAKYDDILYDMIHNIKNNVERNFTDYKITAIGEYNFKPTYTVKVRNVSTPKSMKEDVALAVSQLEDYIKSVQGKAAGNARIDFVEKKADRIEYFVSIPTSKKLNQSMGDDIKIDSTKAVLTYKSELKGNYIFINKNNNTAYNDLVKAGYNRQPNAPYFEVWNRKAIKSKQATNWIFESHYPIYPKAKVVVRDTTYVAKPKPVIAPKELKKDTLK